MGIINFTGFLAAAILLNLIPGSDTIYILSNAAFGNRRKGIISVLGISSGIFVHTVLAAFGLSSILATSVTAFTLVKWAGAGYLVFLGLSSILKKESLLIQKKKNEADYWQIYKQGLLTNVLNPKVALFFLSLLPQYIDSNNQQGALPFLLLGCTFVITSTIWSLCLAFGGGLLSSLINKNERISKLTNKIAGCIYIALGLNLLRASIGDK